MPLRTARYAIAGALALAGCATPTVVDSHATVPVRMFNIAGRFEQDRRQGGMTGVTADIERCYASATVPVVKIYELRDCLVLDYVGYQTDVTIGRRQFRVAMPYFEDQAAFARWTRYGPPAQFDNPNRLVAYLSNGNGLVQLDLARIEAAH